jgi:uncharacterized protein (TIGR03118 family)
MRTILPGLIGTAFLTFGVSTTSFAQYGWTSNPDPGPIKKTSAALVPGYKVTDFDADTSGTAPHTDSRLINPWGIVLDHGLLVVTDNGTGLVTMYASGTGSPSGKAIRVPPPAGQTGTAAPSGIVLNTTKDFLIGTGAHKKPADFIVVTEDGTLSAWNSTLGTNALLMIDNSTSNAVYKGVTIGITSNGPILYLANFRSNTVEMYDSNFAWMGSFQDTNLNALGFAPFNLRVIQDKVVVAFAKQDDEHHDDVPGAGFGYIDIFNLDGTLVRDFASQGPLNSPWGLAVAPLRFGKFSQALLVGNFGDGWINAYNIFTGEYLGPLTDSNGSPLALFGLWGFEFNADPAADDLEYMATTLYFAAGPNGESDGLTGSIKPLSPLFPPVH